MYLGVVRKGRWSVYEVCDSSGTPILRTWTDGLNEKYQGSVRRLYAIIGNVAETQNGPRQLPHDISHEANKKHSIYEFIAGDLRLLWFYSTQNKVIICTGQYLKKGQKVDKQIVAQAIKLKKQYIEDMTSGNIVYL